MSRSDNGSPDPSVEPTRVLIAGSNLLAGTLARTLETHGFATIYTAANAQEIERKLEWRPDLVLIDLRPFSVKSGSTIVKSVQRSGRQVCVIDYAGDGDRPSSLASSRIGGRSQRERTVRPAVPDHHPAHAYRHSRQRPASTGGVDG